jgi:hypothetical protein
MILLAYSAVLVLSRQDKKVTIKTQKAGNLIPAS